MEIFRFQIRDQEEIQKREAFKSAVNLCPLCKTQMKFDHHLDYLENRLTEECRCPECQILIRSEIFKMQ